MTRLLELIVAVVLVFILAVVVAVLLPSSGHIERSATVSKDIRHVYDVFDNFRNFPEYSQLGAGGNVQFQQSPDKWYGPGASISWTSSNQNVGNGKLEIVSAQPSFDQVSVAGQATIVWNVDNDWHGDNKHFTIHLERTGSQQDLVNITWAYDVDYGWNLINRYAGLYIHGRPDELIQHSLAQMQNMLAGIPNIDYGDLDPVLMKVPAQPVLFVSTTSKIGLVEIAAASDQAVAKIQAAMKKLGVHQVGPRIRFTDNFGSQNYRFTVAIPISSDTVTIDGKSYTLTAPKQPKALDAAAVAAASSAPATASSAAAANSTQPEVAAGPQPGDTDNKGHLIINDQVRGMLAFGGKALQGVWYGSPAGLQPTRMRLRAYAETHGYPYDTVNHRFYDVRVLKAGDKGPEGNELAFDQQGFQIRLPVSAGPEQTPEQAAGMKPHLPDFALPASPASTAPAEAATVN